ncbi:PIG-L deacetylase family protein [Ideonella sp. DXS22W]|uniref:PIG-L deacetylase family protein n=1 Tax=Pseudaquabacterium inlustre TaxID=2984192 RepID=A0ABU9CKQ3_9BURK
MAVPWRWLAAALRRASPHWVRNALAAELIGYERWRPPEVLHAPPGRRLLVLAPHPDDESIACGGTLALAVAAGAAVQVVFLTDGRLGDAALRRLPEGSAGRRAAEEALAARRQGEALAALAALGVTEHCFAGAPDGALRAHLATVADQLAPLLVQWRPDTVLLPCFTDRHADHFAANLCLFAAVDRAGPAACAGLRVLGYEAWSPLYANLVVDVDATYAHKRRAIACHASQLAGVDYLAGVEGLNRFRAISSMAGCGHAEAFLAAPLPTYRRLAECLLA